MTLTIRVRGERQTLTAENAFDLVGKLNRSSRDSQSDQREWMKQAADRAHSITGLDVRSDTAGHFLADLLSCGLISDIED